MAEETQKVASEGTPVTPITAAPIMAAQAKDKFPTEVIDLPSKGYFYSKDSALASGQLEVYYMTARHEDILTSRNLIQKGIVIDKLMEALIANPDVKYDDLLIGDKNALMIASRILGYGAKYDVEVVCSECGQKNDVTVDLGKLDDKEIEFLPENKGRNEFVFHLPMCKRSITFKLLTHADERAAEKELEGMRKALKTAVSREVTTRMRYSITAIDGDPDREAVRKFIETMPARDAMAFREYARKVNPDIDMKFDFECSRCSHEERMEVPIDVTFFWPNARV